MIKTRPENIVWIKPIIVKHTVGYVVTIFKESQFQLLTKDDLKVTITVDLDSERHLLFEGIRHRLPHIHIGYSAEADALYTSSPENFINALQKRGLYTPLDALVAA